MSKSDSPDSYIGLFDEPEQIKTKLARAVTDTGRTIKYNPETKPGISNLLTIYSSFSGLTIKEVEKKLQKKGYADLKKQLADLLIEKLEPFRRKRKELLQREVYIKEILKQGSRRAQVTAQTTMQEVKSKMGLI